MEVNGPIVTDIVHLSLDRVRGGSGAEVLAQPRISLSVGLGHIVGGQDRDCRRAGRWQQGGDEDDQSRRETHKSDSGRALENSHATS